MFGRGDADIILRASAGNHGRDYSQKEFSKAGFYTVDFPCIRGGSKAVLGSKGGNPDMSI